MGPPAIRLLWKRAKSQAARRMIALRRRSSSATPARPAGCRERNPSGFIAGLRETSPAPCGGMVFAEMYCRTQSFVASPPTSLHPSIPRQRVLDAIEILDHSGDVDAFRAQIAMRNLIANLIEFQDPLPLVAAPVQNQGKTVPEIQPGVREARSVRRHDARPTLNEYIPRRSGADCAGSPLPVTFRYSRAHHPDGQRSAS